jgi:hypothetical protein
MMLKLYIFLWISIDWSLGYYQVLFFLFFPDFRKKIYETVHFLILQNRFRSVTLLQINDC